VAEPSARAFIVVGPGATARNALVISQVVLSIALPLPMITLLHPKWRHQWAVLQWP
jgi:Mn2+/Fe2+ NRAMP family transporter